MYLDQFFLLFVRLGQSAYRPSYSGPKAIETVVILYFSARFCAAAGFKSVQKTSIDEFRRL